MSLLLTGALVATGVLLGRFAARAAGKKPADAPPPDPKDQAERRAAPDEPKKPARKAASVAIDWSPFPCKLGDVVLRAGGDEAWLAGALVFSEDLPVAVLFVAPDAGGDRAIFARPNPNGSMVWLTPLPADEVKLAGEPPSVIEQGGQRFERSRRLPLRCQRIGSGAPDVGDSAIVAEYTGSTGEALLVIAPSQAGGSPRAWRGALLEEGTYDVLPNGED